MDYKKILDMIIENPELINNILPALVEQFKSPAYAICKEILEIMQDFACADEYFETVAETKINQFNAYLKVGFTREEAMCLILQNDHMMQKTSSSVTNISNYIAKNK